MEREEKSSELIELGSVSEDTLGSLPVGSPEIQVFYQTGLSDE